MPGKKARRRRSVEEVAEKTVQVLKGACRPPFPASPSSPAARCDEEATAHLDAMNKMGHLPWAVTFSYGRALQAAPQKAWAGKAENVAAAQAPSPIAP